MSEYLSLLRDPGHLLYELTLMLLIDGLLIGVGLKFFRKWLRRHDAEVHGK
jgi:hypothetical protein